MTCSVNAMNGRVALRHKRGNPYDICGTRGRVCSNRPSDLLDSGAAQRLIHGRRFALSESARSVRRNSISQATSGHRLIDE